MKTGLVFQKLGGKYQLVIEKPEDLENICEVDEAHWAATGAPCESFTCDPVFLKYLDSDSNGRIRTDEIRLAQHWLFKMLSDRSGITAKSSSLRLNAIDVSHGEGAAIHSAAKLILANLGLSGTPEISIEQVRARQDFLSAGSCNGDGIIPAGHSNGPEIEELIKNIIETQGSVNDISGKSGVDLELLEKFMKEASDFVKWNRRILIPEGIEKTDVMVWGKSTQEAYAAMVPLEKKLDQYFDLCALLIIAPETRTSSSDDKNLLDVMNDKAVRDYILAGPLSKPNADMLFIIDDKMNPAYYDDIIKFKNSVLAKIKTEKNSLSLSFEEWKKLKKDFSLYAEWHNARKGVSVEKIELARLEEYLKGAEADKLRDMIKKDMETAEELGQAGNLEKLILYHKWFFEFTRNFVNFDRLFSDEIVSLIQVGTLIMDERHFDLTMKVANREEHKKIAQKSNICVMYVSLASKKDGNSDSMELAVAVTSGCMSGLYIGKTGVFYTPDRREWDVKVMDFIQQPVSIWEALKMPFKKLGEFIGKQAEKLSSPSQGDIEAGLNKSLLLAKQSMASDPAAAKVQQPGSLLGSGPMLILGSGVGLAALGSSFAFIVNSLKNVSFLQIISFLAAILLMILIPVFIVSMIKLKRRNLGIFLEASGWSINARLYLSRRMGILFTHTPPLPLDSTLRKNDPIKQLRQCVSTERKNVFFWILITVVVIILCMIAGHLIGNSLGLDGEITNVFQSQKP